MAQRHDQPSPNRAQTHTPAGKFAPGNRANPHGRPKMDPEVKKALEALTLPAVAKLAELLKSDDDRVAMQAVHEVLDRNLGKPIQPVAFDPAELDDKELKREVISLAKQWELEELH